MDNVTHSLVGVALSRLPIDKSAAISRSKRQWSAIVWSTVISSNLPDGDLIFRFLPGEPHLNYLLHHRGITHTLFLSPLLAVISAWGALWISKRKEGEAATFQTCWIFSIIGILLHIFADFCNDYGTHFLTPFNGTWFYGDTLFIVEPYLWLSVIPLLIWEGKTKWARITGVGLVLAMVGLGFKSQLIPWLAAIPLAIWFCVFLAIQKRIQGALPSVIGILTVVLSFAVIGAWAKSQVRAWVKAQDPQSKILDIIETPAPANPLCRRVIVSTLDLNGILHLTQGIQTLAPEAFPAPQCFSWSGNPGLAPLQTPTLSSSKHIQWIGEFKGEAAVYSKLRMASCRFRAVSGFLRAPFWSANSEGDYWVGDLRYDRGPKNFTLFKISAQDRCDSLIPAGVKAPAGIE